MLIMKNISILFLITLCSFSGFSQDTITKRNSEVIIAKILEINPSEIKYKKFNFLDGPTYIEKKSDIKMILYSNGTKETFEEVKEVKAEIKISNETDDYVVKASETNKIEMWGSGRFRQKNHSINERNVHKIMMQTKDKKILALVSEAKRSRGMQYIGFAAIPLGVIGLGLLGSSPQYSYAGQITYDEGLLAGGTLCILVAVACPVISIGFKKKRNANNKAAINLYNEKY